MDTPRGSAGLELLPLYGLDIETDTEIDGLDPRVGGIVAVALASERSTEVFMGDEADILRRVERCLAERAPGVIVTWNGANFDLPFLDDRAAHRNVALTLRLERDPRLVPLTEPLAGHEGPYRASWGHHRHLDGFRLYRADVGIRLGISCGLKSIARLAGLTPIEVDRSDIGALSPAELHAYVASDAELARTLVARRWPSCGAAIDPTRVAVHPTQVSVPPEMLDHTSSN